MHALDESQEFWLLETGTIEHRPHLVGPVALLDRPGHVVVEGESVNAPFRQPLQDRRLCGQVERFVTQMVPRVDRQHRPELLERVKNREGRAVAALPAFP